MTEERYDFVQGFMAAINLYGENPFSFGFSLPLGQIKESPRADKKVLAPLPYDKYLEIPTFIRQGKSICA